MLTEATRHRPDVVEARWAIETRRDSLPGLGELTMKKPYLEVTFRHGRPLAAWSRCAPPRRPRSIIVHAVTLRRAEAPA